MDKFAQDNTNDYISTKLINCNPCTKDSNAF